MPYYRALRIHSLAANSGHTYFSYKIVTIDAFLISQVFKLPHSFQTIRYSILVEDISYRRIFVSNQCVLVDG